RWVEYHIRADFDFPSSPRMEGDRMSLPGEGAHSSGFSPQLQQGADASLYDTLVDLSDTPVAAECGPEDIADAVAVAKPHPGFWWSVLWCIVFLSVTQTPGAVVASVEMIIGFALTTRQQAPQQPMDVPKSEHD